MDSFDTHLMSSRDRFRLWPVIGKWSRGVPLVSSPRRSRGMITVRHKTICRYKGHNLNKVASARQMCIEFIFVSQDLVSLAPVLAGPCLHLRPTLSQCDQVFRQKGVNILVKIAKLVAIVNK